MFAPVSMSIPEYHRREVRVGVRRIQLSDQEHKLVVALLRRHPEHWTRAEDLIEEMWGNSRIPDTWLKVIHATCYMVRRKGVPIEGRIGRANGGLRIYRRGRITLVDRVS
jgi:hypothetical protein